MNWSYKFMKDKRCPKCNSLKPALKGGIRNYGANSAPTLSGAVESLRPGGAFTFKNSDSREMRAWMCGGCGFTEFYSPRPVIASSVFKAKQF
jgi:predicted nucleic-acid-binding Zn-ribbon protein